MKGNFETIKVYLKDLKNHLLNGGGKGKAPVEPLPTPSNTTSTREIMPFWGIRYTKETRKNPIVKKVVTKEITEGS